MRHIRIVLVFVALIASCLGASAQSVSERAAVALNATAQSNPPAITLTWRTISSTNSFTVYRKLKTGTSWGSARANLGGGATSWTDNSVALGTNYEYKVTRSSAGQTGTGYINTGVEVPAIDYRGKIVLLVANSISAQLIPELTQLIYDLRADGWGVLTEYVSPSASVTSVRAIVQGHYNSDPANVKAVYIVGHVPVPYSGNVQPDGHPQDRGARPTDGYYAEMDGTWTDNSVNVAVSTHHPQSYNVPGDGKFDQSDFPSDIELQVGRVDMFDMPVFSEGEVQLMRNYLNKAHNYKVRNWEPTVRGLLVDNLGWVGNPLAASVLRTAPMIGLSSPSPSPLLSWSSYVDNNSYLWTGQYGGGLQEQYNGVTTYNGVGGGATSTQLATSINSGGVFNMSLGSFYYDFDNKNNYLKAVIAGGDGLTHVWAGIPSWYFHHMALGENIGYGAHLTMNNNGLYAPITEGWQSSIGKIHLALMGDPTLRVNMLRPPTNLAITNTSGNYSLSWTASADQVDGYHVYRLNADNTIDRLTTSAVTSTSWNSNTAYQEGVDLMVRAVKLHDGLSGSYFNLSLGDIATAPPSQQQFVKVDMRVMLSGPFEGPLMADDLRAGGHIPVSTPYTSPEYVHTNNPAFETIAPSILAVTGNDAIVDWVVVELRTQMNTVFASRSALLTREGRIVDTDGVAAVKFEVAPGLYYVSVRHRNHLGAITQAQVNLSTATTTIDFTSGVVPVFGTEPMKIVNGTACLWAGDVTFDGIIRYTGAGNDRDQILSRVGGVVPTNTVLGYFDEDTNMDGEVKYTGELNDRDIVLQSIGGVVPTNIRTQQIPQ